MKDHVIGIDIGGTTVKIGLFRVSGEGPSGAELLDKTQIPTRTEDHGERILPDVASAVLLMLEKHGISREQVTGAGIGVPGPVLETADGTLVERCVNLGWYHKDAAKEFAALSGLTPVAVTNDANAAALGELYFGLDAADSDDAVRGNAVMVTLGTGVGGGVVVRGSLISGTHGNAGEIGHMKITPSHRLISRILEAAPEEAAADGIFATDDLEHYVSARGIANVGRAYLKYAAGETALRKYRHISAKVIFDEAKKGDPEALELAAFCFDTLGTALADIATVTDPAIFVIGGGVSAAGQFLIDGLQAAYRERAFLACGDAQFRLARLGNDAGIYGAAGLILR
ncbi:MAG: ROK family protein [Mogibacterium sp.]|nr:ROK family protein [Mogibacterium sp.]